MPLSRCFVLLCCLICNLAAVCALTTNRHVCVPVVLPNPGELYRTRNVVVTLYGRSLVNKSVIDIIKTHKWASETYHASLSVGRTAAVLEAISRMAVAPMRLDIGKAAQLFQVGQTHRQTTAVLCHHTLTLANSCSLPAFRSMYSMMNPLPGCHSWLPRLPAPWRSTPQHLLHRPPAVPSQRTLYDTNTTPCTKCTLTQSTNLGPLRCCTALVASVAWLRAC